MIAPDGANVLPPPPPPNVTVSIFAVVVVVYDVVIIIVIFGEGGAPLKSIGGIPHLILLPVSPQLPKPTDLRFPHGGIIDTKGVFRVIPPLNTHHYVPP